MNESQVQPQPPADGEGPDELRLPPLLLGTFTPKIDAKGRMALPAKFRGMLGRGVVLARGQERCVYLLPIGEFRRMAMQIQRASVGDKNLATNLVSMFSTRSTTTAPAVEAAVTDDDRLCLTVRLTVFFGYPFKKLAEAVRTAVVHAIDAQVGVGVARVDVCIDGLVFPKE